MFAERSSTPTNRKGPLDRLNMYHYLAVLYTAVAFVFVALTLRDGGLFVVPAVVFAACATLFYLSASSVPNKPKDKAFTDEQQTTPPGTN